MTRIIIDVREPEEYTSSHLDGAINIPPSKLMGELVELDNIPKDSEIILYCKTGSRSNVAMNILKDKGFSNLVNGINQDRVKAKYFS